MNKADHVFDPALETMFSRRFRNLAESQAITADDSRQLFYLLNQPGKTHDLIPRAYEFITRSLKEAKQVYSPLFLQDYSLEKLTSLQAEKIASLEKRLQTRENLYECVNQTTPVLMTQPCWLQQIAQISTSQSLTAVQLMSLYLKLTRTGQGGVDLLETYHSLLLATGIRIPTLHSFSYSQNAESIPEMFDFGTTQLALAHFPRVLTPEILGFTLAYCRIPTLIEVCFPNQQLSSLFFKLRRQQVEKQLQTLLNSIADFLHLFPLQKQTLWLRIQNGFWLYNLHFQRCRDQFNDRVVNPLSPQQSVARLFQKKSAAAIGHHQKIMLQGKTLDQWLMNMPSNNQEFLQALKHSEFIDELKPLDSPLLKLFEFNGPMFGVFDESEIEIIRNWLKNDLNVDSMPDFKQSENTVYWKTQQSLNFNTVTNYSKLNNRELYYYLVNSDLYPDVLPAAHNKARTLLKACALLSFLPFKHYSHEKFDTYIEKIYRREIKAYRPLQGIPKTSRAAYVWGLEQMAPMILIDGCWLQKCQELRSINPDIYEILFSIYCDEIGNGQLEQNHPYIFQQLLDSLSIQVPPVHSAEFVKHLGFINSAFDLPVYMLSLSSFSVEFLPELLGLNMAIELSGLGKGYLTLVDEWKYWGIDPTIANIHISIDNAASGHTFLAKRAIQLYLDKILKSTGDPLIVDKFWRRIYSGYASLRFVGGRFKLGLPIWYLIHKYR